MDCSMSSFSVLHHLPDLLKFISIGWWCHPTIHPLSSPFPCAFNLSQPQGLFLWVGFSHQMAKVFSFSILPMNIQGWFLLGLTGLISLLSKGLFRDSQKSPAPQFKSISSSVLSLLHGPTPVSIHGYWKNHSCDYTQLCWQRDVSAF